MPTFGRTKQHPRHPRNPQENFAKHPIESLPIAKPSAYTGLQWPNWGNTMTQLYDLAAMKRRLAAIDEERDPLVRMIEAVEAYEGKVGETVKDTGKATIRKRSRPTGIGTGRPPTVMQQTEAVAAELMEATGKPVPTRTVLEVMEARDLPLPDKNRINVVSARLSNSGRFEGRRNEGWWFNDRPWPGELAIATAASRAPEEAPAEREPEEVE
jgi:hypothetical protein